METPESSLRNNPNLPGKTQAFW